MSKCVYERDFEDILIKSIDKMYNFVVSTYGPHGRNVLISDNGKVFLTKDGVTVAKAVEGDSETENAILKVLKQCAERTVQDAGDGTTTSILLAREFIHELLSLGKIWRGIPRMELYNAYVNRIKNVCKQLEMQSEAVDSKETLLSVASIASNNDKQIAELVTELIDSVGVNGSVSIKESKDTQTSIKILEGMRFASKVLSNSFLPDNKDKVILQDCVVVVSNSKIQFSQDILDLLTNAAMNKKSILFVCPDMDEKIIITLATNVERNLLKACVIVPSYLGNEKLEALEDIATVCGTVVGSSSILKRNKIEEWGYAKNIEITRNLTTIMDGAASPEQMDSIIETLKKRLSETEDEFLLNRLVGRINRLTSTIGILYIGGQTPAEITERKHRAEDALESCNSALKKGIVAGGGIGLLSAAQHFEPSNNPFDISIDNSIIKVCKEQSRKLYGTDIVPYRITNDQISEILDLRTYKFTSWKKDGIVESVWAVQSALQNAFSCAWLLTNAYGALVK